MSNKFKSASHCVYNLKYHVVFVVAYRRKAITGKILTTLEAIFSEVCSSLNAELIEFSGEADHVHLLVASPPSLSISRLVATAEKASLLNVLGNNFGVRTVISYGEDDFGLVVIAFLPLEMEQLQTSSSDILKISFARADARCRYPSPHAYAWGIPRLFVKISKLLKL